MERYITANLELAILDEDIITASGANETTSKTVDHCSKGSVCSSGGWTSWTIYYTDGTSETVHANNGYTPEGCE